MGLPYSTPQDALTAMNGANLCKTPFKLLENGTNWLVYCEDTEESSVLGLEHMPVNTTLETIILASPNTIPVKVLASMRLDEPRVMYEDQLFKFLNYAKKDLGKAVKKIETTLGLGLKQATPEITILNIGSDDILVKNYVRAVGAELDATKSTIPNDLVVRRIARKNPSFQEIYAEMMGVTYSKPLKFGFDEIQYSSNNHNWARRPETGAPESLFVQRLPPASQFCNYCGLTANVNKVHEASQALVFGFINDF